MRAGGTEAHAQSERRASPIPVREWPPSTHCALGTARQPDTPRGARVSAHPRARIRASIAPAHARESTPVPRSGEQAARTRKTGAVRQPAHPPRHRGPQTRLQTVAAADCAAPFASTRGRARSVPGAWGTRTAAGSAPAICHTHRWRSRTLPAAPTTPTGAGARYVRWWRQGVAELGESRHASGHCVPGGSTPGPRPAPHRHHLLLLLSPRPPPTRK